MKKNIILAAAVAALSMFASSCQKEEFVGEPAVTGEGLVFTATIDNSATKTTINTDILSAISLAAAPPLPISLVRLLPPAT